MALCQYCQMVLAEDVDTGMVTPCPCLNATKLQYGECSQRNPDGSWSHYSVTLDVNGDPTGAKVDITAAVEAR